MENLTNVDISFAGKRLYLKTIFLHSMNIYTDNVNQ